MCRLRNGYSLASMSHHLDTMWVGLHSHVGNVTVGNCARAWGNHELPLLNSPTHRRRNAFLAHFQSSRRSGDHRPRSDRLRRRWRQQYDTQPQLTRTRSSLPTATNRRTRCSPPTPTRSYGGRVVELLFEGLRGYDSDGKPVNALAESIETTDSQNWTIKVKSGPEVHQR